MVGSAGRLALLSLCFLCTGIALINGTPELRCGNDDVYIPGAAGALQKCKAYQDANLMYCLSYCIQRELGVVNAKTVDFAKAMTVQKDFPAGVKRAALKTGTSCIKLAKFDGSMEGDCPTFKPYAECLGKTIKKVCQIVTPGFYV